FRTHKRLSESLCMCTANAHASVRCFKVDPGSAGVSSTEALHHLMYTAPHFAWTVGGRAALREPLCGSSIQMTAAAFRRDRSSTQTQKRAWLSRQPPAGEKPKKQPP